MIYYCDGYENAKGCGYLVSSDKSSVLSHQNFSPRAYTNNECEYLAVLKAIELASKNDVIYTDSKLVVGQLSWGWKCNYQHLKVLIDKCKNMMSNKPVKIRWINRERNLAGKIIEKI